VQACRRVGERRRFKGTGEVSTRFPKLTFLQNHGSILENTVPDGFLECPESIVYDGVPLGQFPARSGTANNLKNAEPRHKPNPPREGGSDRARWIAERLTPSRNQLGSASDG
jgi:hypothetical protein